MSALTRRRALFSGAAVGSALALPAVVLTGAEPDAELIRICRQHVHNRVAFNSDPEDSGPNNPLWVAYERTYDAISNAEPMTLAGLAAKARATKAEAMEPDGEDPEGVLWWAWDLVDDLVRIGGGAA